MRVVVRTEDTSSGYLTLDNPAREFGDAAILTFGQKFLSTLTPGDMLRLEISGTSGFDDDDESVWGAVTYRTPIGGTGGYGELYFGSVTARRDASGTLAATDIDGNTAILTFGFPFVRDIATYGYGLFELRRALSDVAVGPQSFDSGVTVAGASWIFGKTLPTGGAYEYAVNLAFGERDSHAGEFDDGDSTFFHLRAGAGIERPISWFGPNSSVRAEIWGQYSPDRLPGIEEFYMGGRDEERGYVFAEAQGDSGVSATIEVSRDLFSSASGLRRLRPFGFFDIGYITNNSPSLTELGKETFASLGFGIDAEFNSGIFLRSYVAAPLEGGPSTDAGDPAFYLGLTKSW